MPYHIIRGDITKMETDAIVNAANTALAPGGGVCGTIFRGAGYNELKKECMAIGHCDTGKAVITNGYALKAKYIIHTPGPIYDAGRDDNAPLLYSCYKSSLELAREKSLDSISFPLISAGIYGYPADEAMKVATRAISDFLREFDMEVYLVIYDSAAIRTSIVQFDKISKYIDEHLVVSDIFPNSGMFGSNGYGGFASAPITGETKPQTAPASQKKQKFRLFGKKQKTELGKIILEMDSSFSEYLLNLIDESGMKDSEVYKKANIDRKLFSKIRSNPGYKPSKLTAVAFAIALELDLDGTKALIGRAGYALSHSSKFDIIIEYFITNGNYNIFEINEVLFAFDQPLIGA